MTSEHQHVQVAAVLDNIHRSEGPVDLATLAAPFGWTEDHLARVFREHVGVSPGRYKHHLRAEAARHLLADRSVLEAAIDLGESSPSRVHDLLVTVEAVTPGQARRGGRGVRIAWAEHASVFGPLLVATTDRGVVQLAFTRDEPAATALDDLARRWPAATVTHDHAATAATAARVRTALAGVADDERPLPLLLRGTNLQLAVWRALLRLPPGTTLAYGELATAVGRPDAVRAVASAVGRNPVAPVVPCHRVLRATGALGGYRWGLTTKRRLLAVEAARREQAGTLTVQDDGPSGVQAGDGRATLPV